MWHAYREMHQSHIFSRWISAHEHMEWPAPRSWNRKTPGTPKAPVLSFRNFLPSRMSLSWLLTDWFWLFFKLCINGVILHILSDAWLFFSILCLWNPLMLLYVVHFPCALFSVWWTYHTRFIRLLMEIWAFPVWSCYKFCSYSLSFTCFPVNTHPFFVCVESINGWDCYFIDWHLFSFGRYYFLVIYSRSTNLYLYSHQKSPRAVVPLQTCQHLVSLILVIW